MFHASTTLRAARACSSRKHLKSRFASTYNTGLTKNPACIMVYVDGSVRKVNMCGILPPPTQTSILTVPAALDIRIVYIGLSEFLSYILTGLRYAMIKLDLGPRRVVFLYEDKHRLASCEGRALPMKASAWAELFVTFRQPSPPSKCPCCCLLSMPSMHPAINTRESVPTRACLCLDAITPVAGR